MDPASGELLKNKGPEPRSTLTSNGRISIVRRRFQLTGGGGLMPADALLDLAEATLSLGATELCCRTATRCKGFERGAEELKHLAQLSISTSHLREVVESEGKRVLAASESGALKPNWQAEDCLAKTPDGKEITRVYLGMDAFTMRLLTDKEKKGRREKVQAKRAARSGDKPKLPALARRKKGADQPYKEAEIVQFHDETLKHRVVSVTRKDCVEAGRIMRRDAGRIGFERADERIANFDGGPWIIGLLITWRIVLTAMCLDIYHLGQQVGKGMRATFGEENDEGTKWLEELMHMVKHEGYAPFWDRLVQWRSQFCRGKKREQADQLLNYVAARKDLIVYEQCKAKGWRNSSSTTESECGAVSDRIRGPKRWDGDNAEAMLALEAVRQSHMWEQYWTTAAWQSN